MTDPEPLRPAVLIPTYNNAGTLGEVLEGVLERIDRAFVVDDGSTDDTAGVLECFAGRVEVHRREQNGGKGSALRDGFRLLADTGCTHAITMDADGQHFAHDLPVFLEAVSNDRDALFVGQRDMQGAGAPLRSRFGLQCSNRAFRLLTGVKLRDTQAGFRAYPLDAVQALDLRGCHYDLEMEVLIKAAWSGMPIQPVIIDVSYAPTHGRVSRFRPVTDFARIGWMALRLLSDRRS